MSDLELLDHPTAGSYVPVMRAGDLVYVSGHIGWRDGKASVVGVLGGELSVEQGKVRAMRHCRHWALSTGSSVWTASRLSSGCSAWCVPIPDSRSTPP